MELADLFLLLGKQGLGVVELHLQAAVAGFQFGDAPLGVGLLQFDDPAAEGAQVGPHVLGTWASVSAFTMQIGNMPTSYPTNCG